MNLKYFLTKEIKQDKPFRYPKANYSKKAEKRRKRDALQQSKRIYGDFYEMAKLTNKLEKEIRNVKANEG